MRFRPINDFVLIEPSAAITETEGGIAVPETAQERPREGVVLGCGPGRWEHGAEIPMEVRLGDKVQFGRYAGIDIQIDGQDLLVMREEEVLGVVGSVAREEFSPSVFAQTLRAVAVDVEVWGLEGPIASLKWLIARYDVFRQEALHDSHSSGSTEGEAQGS